MVAVAEPHVPQLHRVAQRRHGSGPWGDGQVGRRTGDGEEVTEHQHGLVAAGQFEREARERGLHGGQGGDQDRDVPDGDGSGTGRRHRPQQTEAGHHGGEQGEPGLYAEFLSVDPLPCRVGGAAFREHPLAQEAADAEEPDLLRGLQVRQEGAVEELPAFRRADRPVHGRPAPTEGDLRAQDGHSGDQDGRGRPGSEQGQRPEEPNEGHQGTEQSDPAAGRVHRGGAAELLGQPQPVQEAGILEAAQAHEPVDGGVQFELGA